MNEEIYDYINKELSLGKTKEQISQHLVQAGKCRFDDLNQVWEDFEQGTKFLSPDIAEDKLQKKTQFLPIIFIVSILFILYIFFAIYEWKKEVKYRMLMQYILAVAVTEYNELSSLLQKGSDADEEITEKCPELMRVHYSLATNILGANVPLKYKESHSFMKDGILNLNLGIVTMCSGFQEQSRSGVIQGLEIRLEGSNAINEGQNFLELEVKNKSLLERTLTR